MITTTNGWIKPELNDEQLQAVKCHEGTHWIIAGAGTGKTRILTERIAYLLSEKNYQPQRILALTFTKKSAQEMKERIKREVKNVDLEFILTFHAFGLLFLKTEYRKLASAKNLNCHQKIKLIGNDHKRTIFRLIDLYKYHDWAPKQKLNGKRPSYAKLIDFISIKKRNPELKVDEIISKVYGLGLDDHQTNGKINENYVNFVNQKYNEYLKKNNFLDLDDLLVQTNNILDKNIEIRKKWQDKFDYILVDEFQDVDPMQCKLICTLAQTHQHLFVVGDPDQLIYSWLGAGLEVINEFKQAFPNLTYLSLRQNYRSSQQILAVANSLIKNNQSTQRKELITSQKGGANVVYRHFENQVAEAKWIANKIKELKEQTKDFKLRNIAIIYRINEWRTMLEAELKKNQIDCHVYGSSNLPKTEQLKTIINYLRAMVWKDDASVGKIINWKSLAINEQVRCYIQELYQKQKINLNEVLRRCCKVKAISEEDRAKISTYYNDINHFKFSPGVKDNLQKIIRVMEARGLISFNEDFPREKLTYFYQYVNAFEQKNPQATLCDFLSERSFINQFEWDEDMVKLMSIHTAKGLEFPYVFVTGLVEGVLPYEYSLSKSDPLEMNAAIEEERRILFVAITRAKEKLYLTSCDKWQDHFSKRSRFIEEMIASIADKSEKEV